MTGDTEATIVVTVSDDLAEIVTDRMWQWGVRAVSETSLGDGRAEVATSVGNDPAAIDRALIALDPDWQVDVRAVDAAIGQVAPEYLSPTWYAPGHVSVPASIHPFDFRDEPPELTTIVAQGSAFGLGDHPTTRTSMALLVAHLRSSGRDLSALSLLDVGCGTGALAVVAAQLGLVHIRAIDIADAAVEATRINAALNDVAGRIDADTTDVADITDTYDIVMANILAPTLISMASDLRRVLAPGGSLFISGILDDRHDHVLAALAPLEPMTSMALDGWITIELR